MFRKDITWYHQSVSSCPVSFSSIYLGDCLPLGLESRFSEQGNTRLCTRALTDEAVCWHRAALVRSSSFPFPLPLQQVRATFMLVFT